MACQAKGEGKGEGRGDNSTPENPSSAAMKTKTKADKSNRGRKVKSGHDKHLNRLFSCFVVASCPSPPHTHSTIPFALKPLQIIHCQKKGSNQEIVKGTRGTSNKRAWNYRDVAGDRCIGNMSNDEIIYK